MRQKIELLSLAAILFVAGRCAANADFVTIDQPNAAYTSATTLLPITAADFSPQTSVTDGTVTATFSISGIPVDLTAFTGNSTWATWGAPPQAETDTPRVLSVPDPADYVNVLINSPFAVKTFGFEAEPDPFNGVHTVEAWFYNGATLEGTISQTLDGNGGSALFAAYSGAGFDQVLISSDTDFAFGQLRYGTTDPTPEPAWEFGFGATLLAAAAALGRYRTVVRARAMRLMS